MSDVKCSYCNKPATDDGSIFHLAGCPGLGFADINRLQLDALSAENQKLREALELVAGLPGFEAQEPYGKTVLAALSKEPK